MKNGYTFSWLEINDTHSFPNSEWWRRHWKTTMNAWNKNRRHKSHWSEVTAISTCAEVVRGPLNWGSYVSLIRAWFHFPASATTYIFLHALDLTSGSSFFVCFVLFCFSSFQTTSEQRIWKFAFSWVCAGFYFFNLFHIFRKFGSL